MTTETRAGLFHFLALLALTFSLIAVTLVLDDLTRITSLPVLVAGPIAIAASIGAARIYRAPR